MWTLKNIAARLGLAALGAAVTSLWFINLCDWIFACGCQAWWAGAADHCNIQQAGHPDCPWCQDGGTPGAVAYALILAAQVAVSFAPGRGGWIWRAVAVIAAFPLVGAGIGVITGLWLGYWR